MKEKIYTIPVNEAFDSGDECPFCHMEREAEQRAIRYFDGPGASYMEPEIRGLTDKAGFCAGHMKKLYEYGNPLGSALMLQTHYAGLIKEFREQTENYEIPARKSLFKRRKPDREQPYWQRLREQVDSCIICDRVRGSVKRYYGTFFYLLREPEFREKVENSKGFCLNHFAQLLQEAEQRLPSAHQEWFYATVYPLMEKNLVRVKEDLDWMIAKYDYRNAGAPWNNSRDALQRAMQKLEGGYPADPPYRQE